MRPITNAIRLTCFGMLVAAWVVATSWAGQSQDTKPKPPPQPTGPMGELPVVFGNESYLQRVHLLRQSRDRYTQDKEWRSHYFQLLGTEFSYIGRYQEALKQFTQDNPQPVKGNAKDLEGYEPRDAVATLLDLADKHQVIMINEAHHVPQHRALTLLLLEGLYRKGFRYFAAETLYAKVEELHKRGYPNRKTGYYTSEPLYADVVRTALRLGYKIVPYECAEAPPQDKANDANGRINHREAGQAQNLKDRIFAKDPTAKVLIHAGYSHIGEKAQVWGQGESKKEQRWMANRFKELTGIDPLTVEQTVMTEMGDAKLERPEYRKAVEQGWVKDKPVIFQESKTGEFYVPPASRGNFDIMVFSPRTRYENGRPHWLALEGLRKPHTIRDAAKPPEGASYLAQAFLANEDIKEAVPVDQIEYRADETPPTLWLPSGACLIRIVDATGRIVHERKTQN